MSKPENKLFIFLKKYAPVLSWVFLFVIALFFLQYLRKNGREALSLFKTISLTYIFLLILSAVFFRLIMGYNFKILMRFFNIKLKFSEWFGLTTVATMTNYLLPAKAGTAAQAVYLKNKYKLGFTQFASSQAGLIVLAFLISSIAGALLELIFRSGQAYWSFFFLFFTLVTAIMLLPVLFMKFLHKLPLKWDILKKIIEGLNNFKDKPHLVKKFVFSQLLALITIGLRMYFAFSCLGINIDIVSCIIISIISSFAIFLSLTPANMGIRELLITASAASFGVTPALSLAAALVDRTIDLIISFVLGGFFIHRFSRERKYES